MSDKKDHEQLQNARQRLYDRNFAQQGTERHSLTDEKIDVTRDWQISTETSNNETPTSQANSQDIPTPPKVDKTPATSFEELKPKRHYRLFVLVGSLLIFIFVAGLSSIFLYFGGNQISNENIGVSVTGPTSVGGGEVVSLQVGVTNQNSVPIESATLIVKYPEGTRSITESDRVLYEERIPINGIDPGEVRNIPLRVAVFGEESNQKEIVATIEYRIEGSNGMFYKDSEPYRFTINSSPLVLRVESVEKVASGQLVEMKIVAQSNASNPLANILVSAQYPNGFAYEDSSPQPVFGTNVWRINELMPEETFEISLTGVVTGLTEETFRINIDAGPAQSDNQFVVSSKLAQSRADFTIERPFIDIGILIDGEDSEVVTLDAEQDASVRVNITNTLDETVYDMVVEVVPGGNALDQNSISSENGFYDSNSGTVRWEVANNPDFAQIFPGGRRSLSFDISPSSVRTTASFNLEVNVYARRVAESNASEQLIGSVVKEGKYSSRILVGGQAEHVSGPIPPVVGQNTTYRMTLVAEAGANEITDAVVNTSLPLYVNWLDNYQTGGEVTYNSVSKQLEWRPGNIASGNREQLTFLVSILPSVSQLDTVPVLVNNQQMRANDRFTGVLLRSSASAILTELSTEAGYQKGNGTVISN